MEAQDAPHFLGKEPRQHASSAAAKRHGACRPSSQDSDWALVT